MISLYMMLYSVERFFVEGLRTDSLMVGPLRQAQLLSLGLIAAGIALYVFLQEKNREVSAMNLKILKPRVCASVPPSGTMSKPFFNGSNSPR